MSMYLNIFKKTQVFTRLEPVSLFYCILREIFFIAKLSRYWRLPKCSRRIRPKHFLIRSGLYGNVEEKDMQSAVMSEGRFGWLLDSCRKSQVRFHRSH